MRKKAIIISCFGWYGNRLRYIECELASRGYEVQVWLGDYSHVTKTKVEKIDNCRYVHVLPYKSNLSPVRIISHFCFGRSVSSIIRRECPDVIYALIPPNNLAKVCSKYKKDHKESKLIFDVIDMWPESFPVRRYLEGPFKVWADMRSDGFCYADHIVTECRMYQSLLSRESGFSTLYLCRNPMNCNGLPEPDWDGKIIRMAYLGTINNLIDIPLINHLITEMVRYFDVEIRVIGTGANVNAFVTSLKNAGAGVEYYGAVFDKEEIERIFRGCHFSLNIMKQIVCIGLTTKSVDYFQLGIPLINNIKGDTESLIREHQCGINLSEIKESVGILRSLSASDYAGMRHATRKVFHDYFDADAFARSVHSVFDGIL